MDSTSSIYIMKDNVCFIKVLLFTFTRVFELQKNSPKTKQINIQFKMQIKYKSLTIEGGSPWWGILKYDS